MFSLFRVLHSVRDGKWLGNILVFVVIFMICDLQFYSAYHIIRFILIILLLHNNAAYQGVVR